MTIPYRSQWDPDATLTRQDCGPACVAMVLQDEGQIVPINTITAELMGPGETGTTAFDLQSSLEKRGVPTEVWRGTSQPTSPAICLVKYSGFKRENVQDKKFMGWHWLILLSIGPDKVVVHDPDWWDPRRDEGSNKVYSRAEWDAAFIPYGVSKIALTWEMKESTVPVQATYGIVNSDPWVRIRDQATTASAILGFLPDKSRIRIVGTTLDALKRPWYRFQVDAPANPVFNDEELKVEKTVPFLGWVAGWLVKIETVTPPPPPPPPPIQAPWLGVNVIASKDALFDSEAKGNKLFFGIDMEYELRGIKQRHPDAVVINRRWIPGSTKPTSGQQLADMIGGQDDGTWYETLNEYDNLSGGTPEQLRERIRVELECCDIQRKRGVLTMMGGYPMGCPDWTQPWVIELMKQYASRYNSDPGVAFSYHPYSPSILRTDPTKPSGTAIRTAIMGQPQMVTGPVGRMGHIATYERQTLWDFAKSSALAGGSIGGPMDEWFEGRWRWLFWKAGFNPKLRKIYGTEGGLDEGGVGGFPAHNATDEQFVYWCEAHQNYQSSPITVNGIVYPSPYAGTAIFTYSKLQNEKWRGFDITLQVPILVRRGWR